MNIGFVGCGNMGTAMLNGILKSEIVSSKEIFVSCNSEKSRSRLTKDFGVEVTDNVTVAKNADVLFLAVKPNMFPKVIEEIKEVVAEKNSLVISIAAGMTIEKIEELFDSSSLFEDKMRLVRTMPNTPALVGEGMTAMSVNKNISEEDKVLVEKIFESFGKAEFVSENLMDAVIGVSGSSPAFVYMLIEAMADGAVQAGMPQDKAYKFAAQSVLGSAKMVLETGKDPEELIDAVCSPGGTTIAGVNALEENGFEELVIAGEMAAVERSREMSK